MKNIKKSIYLNFSCMHQEMRDSLDHYMDQEELPHDLRALDWLMAATKVHRLFSLADIRELIIRANLLFEINRPIDNWFKEAYLFKYEINGLCYHFKLDSIYQYAGIIQNESAESYAPRLHFMKGLKLSLSIGSLLANLSDMKIQTMEESFLMDTASRSRRYFEKNYANYFSEEKFKQSEYFAKIVIQEAPKGIFKGLEDTFADKKIELDFKEELRKATPVFKFSEIDLPIRLQFAQIILDQKTFLTSYLLNDEETLKEVSFLMHTAWALANDLLKEEPEGAISYSQYLWGHDRDGMKAYGHKYALSHLMETYPLEKTFQLVKNLFAPHKFKEMREELTDGSY